MKTSSGGWVGHPPGARAPGKQAASRSPWSTAGTPESCCARCSAVCFSQVRRGQGGDKQAGGTPRGAEGTRGRRATVGTWDTSLTVRAWGRGAFLLRGAVKARLAEQLAGPEGIATLDGTGAAPWPLKSLILSASFRALGAPRTQTSQAARTQDPLEPAPRPPERSRGRPGAGLKHDGGDVGHGPRRRASRGKEESPFGGGRVLAGSRQIPADGKSWYPLTHLGPRARLATERSTNVHSSRRSRTKGPERAAHSHPDWGDPVHQSSPSPLRSAT